jgi:hypothetical protein
MLTLIDGEARPAIRLEELRARTATFLAFLASNVSSGDSATFAAR